jgi:LysR family transcriptional regulator, transcriptional activator of nhaA
MEQLNYHHLRYFWTAAREGSLARAAARLHVSQPSISEQIHELESALGEKLFRREGRNNKLTDAGQIVFGYADEIFALGRELQTVVKQNPNAKSLRLLVGVENSFPKLVTSEILRPVFRLAQAVHVVCREGRMEDLLAQLAAHRLDIVLAEEPAPSSMKVRTFNQLLGESGVTFCAPAGLACTLKRQFPRSLHDAPAFLPAENTSLRRALEQWFREVKIQPRVLAEFEDLALMKEMASEGGVFIALPSVVAREAESRYQFQSVGTVGRCKARFFAISAERKITHPAVKLITENAQAALFSSGEE